jgi:metal-responsive CopG/Arc/MetJ family transcriptional regulator
LSRVGYNTGHTGGMKTAVSLPDELFRLAETTARRLRVSRSQLYATAIAEFLDRQQLNTVTERLNEIYLRTHAKVDAPPHRAQLR